MAHKSEGGNLFLGASGSSHTYDNVEKEAFTDFVNHALAKDKDLAGVLPLSKEGDSLFNACKDGILLW